MTAKVVQVVGLPFQRGYPGNVYRLQEALDQFAPVEGPRQQGESFPVVLFPRPDNPHDPNAVEVHIPRYGDLVGHLPRTHAAYVGPLLVPDAPWRFTAWVSEVRGDPDELDKPKLFIAIRRTPNNEGTLP